MELDFVRIECDITAAIPVPLISALHDVLRNFEGHFKASCCPTGEESCALCSEKAACPYRNVFAQQLSPDSEIVRLHQKPSLPFTLYIDEMDSVASSCTVGMVIVGNAVNYTDFFHSALFRMVESCVDVEASPGHSPLRFYSLDYQDVRHEIAPAAPLSESVILLSARHILENSVHADHVRLSVKAPMRLMSNGAIAHHFDFAMFFRSQLRRCSSLCSYYGTGKLELDFAYLSRAAQIVAVLEDGMHYTRPLWSKRPNRAGLAGTAECSGLIEPMFSLLLLGSYFNAGKGAAYGAGHYTLERLN